MTSSSSHAPRPSVAARGSVLVVDDHLPSRDMLAALLEKEGFIVSAAAGGTAALALLETTAPTALVTDLHMPEMDGVALLRAGRRLHPGMIVVLVSGDGHRPAAAIEERVDGYLTKPIEVDEILSVLDAAIQVRRQEAVSGSSRPEANPGAGIPAARAPLSEV